MLRFCDRKAGRRCWPPMIMIAPVGNRASDVGTVAALATRVATPMIRPRRLHLTVQVATPPGLPQTAKKLMVAGLKAAAKTDHEAAETGARAEGLHPWLRAEKAILGVGGRAGLRLKLVKAGGRATVAGGIGRRATAHRINMHGMSGTAQSAASCRAEWSATGQRPW